MNNGLVEFISALAAIIGSVTLATWVLSNKIAAGNAQVTAQISDLKTDIAVMQKSEEARDEKINRMWQWWLAALENGWVSHMNRVGKGDAS